MQYSTLTTLALALATLGSSAPAIQPILGARQGNDPNTCTMSGVLSISQVVGSGGPGQAPVTSTYNALSVSYTGSTGISPSTFGNSIAIGGTTYQSSDTGLPSPITWTPNFNFGFQSCSVQYEGRVYNNGPITSTVPTLGENYWQCDVYFPCEVNL